MCFCLCESVFVGDLCPHLLSKIFLPGCSAAVRGYHGTPVSIGSLLDAIMGPLSPLATCLTLNHEKVTASGGVRKLFSLENT